MILKEIYGSVSTNIFPFLLFFPCGWQATIALGSQAGPQKIADTMAFMFESCLIPRVCQWALESPNMDHDYYQCWIGLKSHFTCEATTVENTDLQNGHN